MCGVWLCLAVGLFAGCGTKTEDETIILETEQEGISYDLATAQTGDVTKTVNLNCTYRQTDEQEVCFSISGRLVDQVYVKKGDQVKKGQLLAELSAGELERQIEDLEYRIARNELLDGYIDTNEAYDISGLWVSYLYYSGMSEKDKENLDEQIESVKRSYRYSREDYEDALEVDREELEELKQELASCRLYAGMDGVVYQMSADLEGSTSKEGETVMTIADTTQKLFELSQPEYADYFREGELYTMTVSASGAAGEYQVIPWERDDWGEEQLFMVYDGPYTSNLTVGTTGVIRLVTDERKGVLTVPLNAIHSADGKAYVYVVADDGMRQVVWVETGLYGDNTVEILDGLTGGEKVILR